MTIEKKTAGSTTELSLNGWMDTQSAPDTPNSAVNPDPDYRINSFYDLNL